ncbi:hypothetical protein [Maliponia aquimaris]|uniref:Uncharacterized protein n=1 Tax=Maliponia aquimaris TaxID=1673631 RepID=A0A238K1M5_9RHOB|nr:hypothetical protein [Maliponia aquimaris]SMX36799.1 hypothetical protein MAA8898_01050 [Maliponia aquimaris]
MSRDEAILLFGTLAIVLGGMAADLWVSPDAFARAGAVLVVFGVVSVGRALLAAERAHARHETRFEKLEAAYLDAAMTEAGQISPEAFSRLAESYSSLRQARVTRESRLMKAEIGIVCLGTLIWGFGDLAFANPHCTPTMGALTC